MYNIQTFLVEITKQSEWGFNQLPQETENYYVLLIGYQSILEKRVLNKFVLRIQDILEINCTLRSCEVL